MIATTVDGRMLALLGGADSGESLTDGTAARAVLLGIVATCRAVGVPVQAFLAWVFDRLGTHRELSHRLPGVVERPIFASLRRT